jgi:hypothetical protein
MTAIRIGALAGAAVLLAGLGVSVAAAPARACGKTAVPGSTEVANGFTSAKVSMSTWINSCNNTVYASSTSFKDSGGYFFKGHEAVALEVINPPGNYGPPANLCAAPNVACDSQGISLSLAPNGGTADACYTTYNGNFRSHPNSTSSETFCTPVVNVR